jgi:hypothetical protein
VVEPISLSLGAIVAALVARASDKVADDAVEAGEGAVSKLVAAVRRRFSRDRDELAAEALARVEDVPDSPSRVKALADVVDERAQRDDDLRSEFEQLVAEARGAGVKVDSITQSAFGNQNVQIAGVSDSQINVSHGSSQPPRPDG